MNEDHFIVAQRVTQNAADNNGLIPMVEEAERRVGRRRKRFWPMRDFSRWNERRPTGDATWHGSLLPGFEFGAGIEHGATLLTNAAQPTASAMRQKLRRPTRTSSLPTTQGHSGTGLGNVERTTWNAAISVAGNGESKHRVHAGGNLVQPDQATGCTPLPRPANLAMAQLIAPKRSHAVSLAPEGISYLRETTSPQIDQLKIRNSRLFCNVPLTIIRKSAGRISRSLARR